MGNCAAMRCCVVLIVGNFLFGSKLQKEAGRVLIIRNYWIEWVKVDVTSIIHFQSDSRNVHCIHVRLAGSH